MLSIGGISLSNPNETYLRKVNQSIDAALKDKSNFHVNKIFASQEVVKVERGDQSAVRTASDGELQSE